MQALVLTGMSTGQVSEMAKELDEVVTGFRNRPLDQISYTCLWLDAITQRCRRTGEDGGVLDLGVTNEEGTGGKAFLHSLVARDLAEMEEVTPNAHWGLKSTLTPKLPPGRRAKMPHTRNLLTKVAKRVLRGRHLKMRSVFAPPDTKEVWAQYGRIVEQLEKRYSGGPLPQLPRYRQPGGRRDGPKQITGRTTSGLLLGPARP